MKRINKLVFILRTIFINDFCQMKAIRYLNILYLYFQKEDKILNSNLL